MISSKEVNSLLCDKLRNMIIELDTMGFTDDKFDRKEMLEEIEERREDNDIQETVEAYNGFKTVLEMTRIIYVKEKGNKND